jgi:hypothetical protein
MITKDERYVLEQANSKFGYMPNTQAGVSLAMGLEYRDLCRQMGNHPIWYITDKGKQELANAKV